MEVVTQKNLSEVEIPVIECIGVSKRFGAIPAIDEVSLAVQSGTILALVGPSGCGKTTLLRLIAGFETPDSGTIMLEGNCVAWAGGLVTAEKRKVGLVFQDYALFPHMTAIDNVAFGLTIYEKRERYERAKEALAHAHIGHLANRYPYQLSGGEQQRVALVRSVAPRPLLILLDEPFSNLDPNLRAEFRQELRQVIASTKIPAIYVTHDRDEALAVGDTIAILHDGRLDQIGSAEELYERPINRFTAQFLGSATFLQAEVTTTGFMTELGAINQKVPMDLVGSTVELLIRPDTPQLIPTEEGSGQVVEHQYQGSHRFYVVKLLSGQCIQTLQPHHMSLAVGQRVSVTLDSTHPVWYFPL
jgi:iron(III) transport system ATP-binding protein